MHQIEISDFIVDVVRKDIKNIHLSVYPPTGRVRIAAPLEVDDDTIKLFAVSKIAWIKRNQRKFEKQDRQSARVFQTRESHYFEGKRYLLRITETEAKPKVVIKSKNHIDLYVRPNTPPGRRSKVLNEWYRNQLRLKIPSLVKKWEKIMELSVAEWDIQQMKTKWGSCNIEKRSILLNLELVKKPVQCLEYIIVHEMVHLLERHHNERFLFYMETYMPDWKQAKEELNRFPLKMVVFPHSDQTTVKKL